MPRRHPKYALEMLHLLHNILHVWPKALRDLVLNNWLVNPTGTPDGFVSLDLMQEHLNFWIKRVYAAHGSNASWDWLAKISPCIDLLRKLANHMNTTLGSRQGKKHCPADLTRDIDVLLESLIEHGVYVKEPGRRVDADDPPVTDLSSRGLESLTNGAKNTLGEFNEAFKTLQRRNKVKPLFPFVLAATIRAETPSRAAADDPGERDASEGSSSDESDVEEPEEAPAQSRVPEHDTEGEPTRVFSYDDEQDVDLDPDNVYETDGDSSGSDADSDGELD